jgi:NAD(P)-dependent dehydrogenase (short-subunit alcohol dehydrogenase family)
VLINNAGARFDTYQESADGIELTFATNYLSHFALAYALARRLSKTRMTSNAADPGGVATRLARNNGLFSWFKHLGYYAMKRQLLPPRRAAETIVYLAASSDVNFATGG